MVLLDGELASCSHGFLGPSNDKTIQVTGNVLRTVRREFVESVVVSIRQEASSVEWSRRRPLGSTHCVTQRHRRTTLSQSSCSVKSSSARSGCTVDSSSSLPFRHAHDSLAPHCQLRIASPKSTLTTTCESQRQLVVPASSTEV